MPRWNNNPVDVSLGIKIYDDGGYRLKIVNLKPFVNTLKPGAVDKQGAPLTEAPYGIRATCKILAAPDQRDVGQTYMVNMYQHNDGGRSFSKGFQCPVYGFPANEEGEKKFDEIAKDIDWSADSDTGDLGDGWKNMLNKEVNAELGQKVGNTGDKQQTAKYMPI